MRIIAAAGALEEEILTKLDSFDSAPSRLFRSPGRIVRSAPRGAGPSALRSLAKAVSWRGVGALDTFAVSYLVTGRIAWAGSIVSVEILTKIALYFLHERAWAHLHWGRGDESFHRRDEP